MRDNLEMSDKIVLFLMQCSKTSTIDLGDFFLNRNPVLPETTASLQPGHPKPEKHNLMPKLPLLLLENLPVGGQHKYMSFSQHTMHFVGKTANFHRAITV